MSILIVEDGKKEKVSARWPYVIPWHADADEPEDPNGVIDTFAATHCDIVGAPSEGIRKACPCSAPSSACDSCRTDDDIAKLEFLLEELVIQAKANARARPRFEELTATAGKAEARMTAPMARGSRARLAK